MKRCFNQTAAATKWFDVYENRAQYNLIFPPKTMKIKDQAMKFASAETDTVAQVLLHYLVQGPHC